MKHGMTSVIHHTPHSIHTADRQAVIKMHRYTDARTTQTNMNTHRHTEYLRTHKQTQHNTTHHSTPHPTHHTHTHTTKQITQPLPLPLPLPHHRHLWEKVGMALLGIGFRNPQDSGLERAFREPSPLSFPTLPLTFFFPTNPVDSDLTDRGSLSDLGDVPSKYFSIRLGSLDVKTRIPSTHLIFTCRRTGSRSKNFDTKFGQKT